MTCPNRDGTLGAGGCIFCSAGGSGEFTGGSLEQAENKGTVSIWQQIEAGKRLLSILFLNLLFYFFYEKTFGGRECPQSAVCLADNGKIKIHFIDVVICGAASRLLKHEKFYVIIAFLRKTPGFHRRFRRIIPAQDGHGPRGQLQFHRL